MQIATLIEKYYQQFYNKVVGKDAKAFEARDHSMIYNFTETLNEKYGRESVGSALLFEYFVFQFDYWITADNFGGNNLIKLSWIIGKKAFVRWIDRPFRDMIKAHSHLREYEVYLIVEPTVAINVFELRQSEELEKKRFHNKTLGFENCNEATTLYNHKSPLCISCNSNDICKLQLRKDFPTIYIKRGYDTATKRKTRRRR